MQPWGNFDGAYSYILKVPCLFSPFSVGRERVKVESWNFYTDWPGTEAGTKPWPTFGAPVQGKTDPSNFCIFLAHFLILERVVPYLNSYLRHGHESHVSKLWPNNENTLRYPFAIRVISCVVTKRKTLLHVVLPEGNSPTQCYLKKCSLLLLFSCLLA